MAARWRCFSVRNRLNQQQRTIIAELKAKGLAPTLEGAQEYREKEAEKWAALGVLRM
jgi:hypothetical protein